MNYILRTPSLVIVDVPSSSSLDAPHVAQTRRGTVHRTLSGRVIQYMETPSVGDVEIRWTIPLANGHEYGRLYSASIGAFGDQLTLTSPRWGDIPVAFAPGPDSFRPKKHQPDTFGYEIEVLLIRTA